MQFPARDLLSR